MMYKSIFTLLMLSFRQAPASPVGPVALAPYYPKTISPIDGEYIIMFKPGYTLAEHFQVVPDLQALELKPFGYPFTKGYGAALTDDVLLSVRQDSGVDYVDQDSHGEWALLDEPPHRNDTVETHALTTRIDANHAGYALAYISSKNKNPAKPIYHYVPNSGADVDIYIVDSGITPNQAEFGDRVINYINIAGDGTFDDTYDKNGHGTGVAACAGSYNFGSAKKPNLVNVKVTTSGINLMLALTKVQERHEQRKDQTNFKGSVVNMSFHTQAGKATIDAVRSAYEAGIAMVAAAGNQATENSANFPCDSAYVICVGASNQQYQLSQFSNYGQPVDFFASGSKISSINNQGNVYTPSGTSFSSPFTAGVVAIFYGYLGYGNMSPSKAMDLLNYNADSGYLVNLPADTRNLMVNSGYLKGIDGQPFLMKYPS